MTKYKKAKMKTYSDLLVWQKSLSLVTEVYQISKRFPTDEQYSLTSQIRRCGISIPSNIAEGYGRNSKQDFIRFLRIAMGSLFELQTQLRIANNLNYSKKDDFNLIFEKSREVERMLSAFIKSIEK